VPLLHGANSKVLGFEQCNIRVVHGSHSLAIFDSFLIPFSAHFLPNKENDAKNDEKNDEKNGYCEHPGKPK